MLTWCFCDPSNRCNRENGHGAVFKLNFPLGFVLNFKHGTLAATPFFGLGTDHDDCVAGLRILVCLQHKYKIARDESTPCTS